MNNTDTIEKTEQASTPETGVVKLNVTDTAIAEFKSKYLPLKVNGIEDKEGLKAVYEARQEVKRVRVALQKYAKEKKEDALEWQRKVNTEEKRILGELKPIEDHLQAEEDKIEAEKQRIKQEAIDAENARVQLRVDALMELGFKVDVGVLKVISDEAFATVLDTAKQKKEAELAAQAEEKRLAEIAAAKLLADQEELRILREQQAAAQKIIDAENSRKAAEQKAAQDKIDAENKRIADEKAELKRQQDLQKAREEAAEQARIRAVEEAKTAERHRLEAEAAAKIEATRLAALQPDKDKLLLIADDVSVFMNNYNKVSFKSDQSKDIFNQVALMMSKVETHIRTKVKSL